MPNAGESLGDSHPDRSARERQRQCVAAVNRDNAIVILDRLRATQSHFLASSEPGIPGPEHTKTWSQRPGFEYRLRFGGLSKKRLLMVGREGVEPPKLSRRFYRPLGSPRALCRPSTPTSGGKREA